MKWTYRDLLDNTAQFLGVLEDEIKKRNVKRRRRDAH